MLAAAGEPGGRMMSHELDCLLGEEGAEGGGVVRGDAARSGCGDESAERAAKSFKHPSPRCRAATCIPGASSVKVVNPASLSWWTERGVGEEERLVSRLLGCELLAEDGRRALAQPAPGGDGSEFGGEDLLPSAPECWWWRGSFLRMGGGDGGRGEPSAGGWSKIGASDAHDEEGECMVCRK